MAQPGFDADVIIVGGGPVGLTAALDLDRRGVTTVVVETRPFPHKPNVKCNHISSRTMERFRQLGIADEVRSAGLPADYPHDVAFRTRMTGIEFARIPISSRQQRRSGPVGPDASWATPEGPHRVNQKFLEPILQHRALSRPNITVLTETTCLEVGQDADSVYAFVADAAGDGGRKLRGRFLIGADGGRSLVRKTIGASFQGDPVLQHVQSTCIRAEGLYDLMPGRRAWCYYTFNSRRGGHVYAIDGESLFLVHNHLHAGEQDVDRDASIRAILGVDDDFAYDEVSKEDWIARRLVADRFRDGRLFIAGDAAHLWVPYAGYGLNAGIADVLNLTWTLAAYLDGWADEAILDAYEAERQPITEQVSRFAMSHQRKVVADQMPPELEDDTPAGEAARAAFGRLVYDTNVQQFAAAGLNFGYAYTDSPLISYGGEEPPGYTMGTYTPSTVPGCRAPHFWLPDGRSLYDALGRGYTLLALDDATELASVVAAAAERGMPLAVVHVEPGIAPPAYRHRFVIVRDDQHVVWRGDCAPDDAAALVDRLSGRARARTASAAGAGRHDGKGTHG